MARLKAWLAFKLIQENCGGFILIFGKTNTIMYSLKNKIKLKKKKREHRKRITTLLRLDNSLKEFCSGRTEMEF